jgi:hypothetical protein
MREKEKYTSGASAPDEADEALRRRAAERLADHLEIGISLAGHCEMMAGKTTGDRLKPVFAAAQLMRANAVVAEALVNVGQIERRRRSIVERVQTVDSKKAELNSHLQEEKATAEERFKLLKHVGGLLEQMNRSEQVDEGEKARLAGIIQDQLSAIEALPVEGADEDLHDNAP